MLPDIICLFQVSVGQDQEEVPSSLSYIVASISQAWCMCVAQMEADGHRCTSIQGDMEKEARDRVVTEFRDGATKILISTDVLARGFDVTQARPPHAMQPVSGLHACALWQSVAVRSLTSLRTHSATANQDCPSLAGLTHRVPSYKGSLRRFWPYTAPPPSLSLPLVSLLPQKLFLVATPKQHTHSPAHQT